MISVLKGDFVAWLADFVWNYIAIIPLIGAGLFFTVSTGVVQLRYLGEMFRLLGDDSIRSGSHGRISSLQAFCVSAASRIGVGNLAGVATAIAVGGPGAVFWMWVMAVIGAASSFCECTLAQVFKVRSSDSFIGGPAFYMLYGLKSRWLGVLIAVLICITFGFCFNSVQANTITIALYDSFGFDRVVCGFVLAFLAALIIFGGIRRIAIVSSVIVPVMAVFYVGIAFYVLFSHFSLIPDMIVLIFRSAFGLDQFVGGGIGVALMQGIRRGLFSNEAGMGSAPNVAATAVVSHPVKQGFIQALGVYLDTLVICSCTALIILLSGVSIDGSVKGIQLTQMAMDSLFDSMGGYFVSLAILLFGFSTIIGCYYYGEANILFISRRREVMLFYRLCVVGMVLFGSLVSLDVVWSLADFFMALIALTNLSAVFLLNWVVRGALRDYLHQKRKGQNPVFTRDSVPRLKNDIECW